MTGIDQRHAALASHFADLIANVSDWGAPTPVKEWAARDIVAHLISWPPALLGSVGVDLPAVEIGDDLALAWAEHSANVQAILEDREQLDRTIDVGQGPASLESVLDSFYLSDIFMHTWDLAKASGQDPQLDPAVVKGMVEGMTPMADYLAGSGQFGTPVVLDETHSDEDRLVALIGRDPNWTR